MHPALSMLLCSQLGHTPLAEASQSAVIMALAKPIVAWLVLSRLRQLDESNGLTAVDIAGDDTTDSAEDARTGQVHAAAKEDIVRHWLQGSLDNVSPSGQLQYHTANALPCAHCHSSAFLQSMQLLLSASCVSITGLPSLLVT